MEDVKFVPLSSNSGVIACKLTEKGSTHGTDFETRCMRRMKLSKPDCSDAVRRKSRKARLQD